MRKILTLILLLSGLSSAQALYDVVAGTDLTFTLSGSALPSYTMEFRFKANTTYTSILNAPSDVACRFINTNISQCYSGTENLGGTIALTNGNDYRVRYMQDSPNATVYMTVWTGDCQLVGQVYTTVKIYALPIAGTWTLGNHQQFGFWRLYTGTAGSAAGCPVDRPATPADKFDFPFENAGGTAGNVVSLSGGGSMSGTVSSTPTSTTYNPTAVISGSAPKLTGPLGTNFTLSAANSRSYFWPGTGAPSSYSWSQTAGPGTCTITNGSTATATLNCNTATSTTDYTIQLQVTDPTPTTATTSQHVGVVQVDANDNVVISNADFKVAIADGKPLPRYGSANIPLPWWHATEAADADLMAAPIAAAVNMVAGAGTVSLNTTTGVLTASVAAFTAADNQTYIEITWDPDGDSSFSGRFVAYVNNYTDTQHVTLQMPGNEPQGSFPAGLSWNRIAVGPGSCGALTATVSGGQVTGISGYASCSGFSWWAFSNPTVNLVLGGASGCNVSANILNPNTTGDPAQYGKIDPSNPWNNLPCGTGYSSAPTVTVVPESNYTQYNIDANGGIQAPLFNYYSFGLGVGRLAVRTGLAAYYTEWHNLCTQTYRWSDDSGWNTAFAPRQSSLDMLIACATDPSWTPPGGRNKMFAGVANMLINGTLSPNNPNSGYIASIGGVGAMQPREQSYITRPAAKLAHIGGSYGLTQATWCGYLAAQFDNAWTPDLVNPPGDSTAAYFPINSFSYSNGTWLYPSAGSPPGSTSYGTAPWRDEGLPAIAFAGAYSAFVACGGGYSSYATTAANYVNLLATFLWNYGTSGDGGSMYDINNTSDGLSPLITWNTEVISGGHTQQTGTIAVVAGTNTVNGTNTNFTRNFWPGAKISIQGTTYTVATTPSNTTLTLTVNFTGSNNATEIVFGNTCTIDVTNGMTSVVGHTGTGCDFTVMFGGTNPYIGILTNGGMNPLDARVYKITVNSAASGTLNTAFVGTTGTTAYFVYAPPSPTSCGTSLASACFYGQPGGRNLSQDVCYAYAWEYAYTASATWKTRAQFCYDKQYGGSSAGGVWGGGPNGYSTYYRPGVITATNGSTAVVGYAGLNGDATAFLTQFPHPGTDKVMIADGLTVDGNGVGNGQWNNPSAYLSYLYSTWYLYTVTAVADDYHLTLSAPFAGTTSTKSAIFYNPADAQWTGGGADGGYGVLESILPRCQNAYTSTQYNYPPCGGFDFTVHSGKSPGMGSGAGNAAMGVAIAALTYVTIPGNIFQFVSKGLSWK